MTADGPPLPAGLTRNADKARYYSADSYFVEALEQLGALTPDPVGFAARHALLLLKPDAIVSRSVERIVDWLSESDFRIVAAQRVRLERGAVRAMWHYQLNRATPQRCLLADTIARTGDSLVLLLRQEGDLPATVTLSSRKGPADPAKRHPDQLRSRLGDFGFLLNLVHASDEPADLVRELGILLDAPARRALFSAALADRPVDVQALTEELYAGSAAHDLAFEPAVTRLRRAVETMLEDGAFVVPHRVLIELGRALEATTAEAASWAPLIELIWAADLPLTDWDFIVVGNSALPLSRPQYRQLLPGVDPDQWRSLAAAEVS